MRQADTWQWAVVKVVQHEEHVQHSRNTHSESIRQQISYKVYFPYFINKKKVEILMNQGISKSHTLETIKYY